MRATRKVKRATYHTVWAMLRETVARQEEADREMKELRESQKETDRLARETTVKVGELGNRLGDWVAYTAKPGIVKKFKELGISFSKVRCKLKIKNKEDERIAEADIFLENADIVIVVECKSKPIVGDIYEHIARMEKIRANANLFNDTRKYYGGIAGIVVNENERKFALKHGFYVAEPSCSTFDLAVPSGSNSLRVW